MKIVHVGLGDFGYSWYHDVLLNYDGIEIVGLVDKKIQKIRSEKEFSKNHESVFFESLEEALESDRPDFIINATPPKFHKDIDIIALKAGIPVLSEKPISENLSDSVEIMAASNEYNVSIMIAENYRYMEVIRKAKSLLEAGIIGPIHSVAVDFFRNHRMTNYHKDLKHPLLLDVSIHHFDVLRYLTNSEVNGVFAESWNPAWSWYKGLSCLNAQLEMDSGIKASYRGSLSSPVNSTGWLGSWRIEGSLGVMEICENHIKTIRSNGYKMLTISEDEDSRKRVLREFIASLKEKRLGETDIHDNFKTFSIVHAVMESVKRHAIFNIKE